MNKSKDDYMTWRRTMRMPVAMGEEVERIAREQKLGVSALMRMVMLHYMDEIPDRDAHLCRQEVRDPESRVNSLCVLASGHKGSCRG